MEDFSARVIVLTLSKDTSKLASTTGLTVPRKITEDLAEALLTARHYLDFRGAGDLKGQAKKWLVNSPFDGLEGHHISALDNMKSVRNYIAHRSRQSRTAYHKVLIDADVPTSTTPGHSFRSSFRPGWTHISTLS